LDDSKSRVDAALQHWVAIRKMQKEKSTSGGRAQEGNRSAVTGGAHLDGLNQLVVDEIGAAGTTGLSFVTNRGATVAGYYRASKSWDLAVLKEGSPILLAEYKSMSGSEGKNLNNRADEVFGVAEDARQAEEHGLLPGNLLRAYIFVMGITPESTRPIGVAPNLLGTADPEFEGASYLKRIAIMCKRLRETGLYSLTWAIGVQEDPFLWKDIDPEVGWDRFATDIKEAFS
jgi:hypothetical protein